MQKPNLPKLNPKALIGCGVFVVVLLTTLVYFVRSGGESAEQLPDATQTEQVIPDAPAGVEATTAPQANVIPFSRGGKFQTVKFQLAAADTSASAPSASVLQAEQPKGSAVLETNGSCDVYVVDDARLTEKFKAFIAEKKCEIHRAWQDDTPAKAAANS